MVTPHIVSADGQENGTVNKCQILKTSLYYVIWKLKRQVTVSKTLNLLNLFQSHSSLERRIYYLSVAAFCTFKICFCSLLKGAYCTVCTSTRQLGCQWLHWTTKTWRLWWCRLVLLIRDPVPFWPLDPGFGMGKKIKIRILDPGWTSRIIFPRAWKQSGIRNLFKLGSVTLMPMMECFSIQNM